MIDILEEISRDALQRFLARCAKHCAIDAAVARDVIANLVKESRGEAPDETALREIRRLERMWYQSLTSGRPEYAVYSEPYYFCDVWMCWVTYSRKYLKAIQSATSLGTRSIVSDMQRIGTVLDLGCGIGYTAAALKQIFPAANVIGTNLPGTAQFAMAEELGASHGFKVAPGFSDLRADLMFASEYFEHMEAPIEHLADVLRSCKPRYLLIANTFNSPAIGHFLTYRYRGEAFTGKQMSRMFNASLRYFGYKLTPTRCWNNRPAYWTR